MKISGKREAFFLLLGDLFVFVASLWLALLLRHLEVPESETFLLHLKPFSFLFVAWVLVFYIGGLYEKHTLVFQNRLSAVIFTSQIINSFLATSFFYLTPYFSIAPKTVLFVYLVVSFALLLLWRLFLSKIIFRRKKQNALLIGTGDDMDELLREVNGSGHYPFRFLVAVDAENLGRIDFEHEVIRRVYSENIAIIVIDLKNEKVAPVLPHLYNLLFAHVHFFDLHRVYEEVFDRIPLSLVRHDWILENVTTISKATYDFFKRCMDIFLAFILGIISLLLYLFVVIAIKLDDGERIFFNQTRVGQGNKPVTLFKFRTMSSVGKEGREFDRKKFVTRVGKILRKSRIDELPQLWNVLRGDISLIGPRPEIPELVKDYESKIPYYGIRHLLKPGLSGWAQIYHDAHPHHEIDIVETKRKLSYDLYYIKNRSLTLDVKIALKTIRTLLSRSGR